MNSTPDPQFSLGDCVCVEGVSFTVTDRKWYEYNNEWRYGLNGGIYTETELWRGESCLSFGKERAMSNWSGLIDWKREKQEREREFKKGDKVLIPGDKLPYTVVNYQGSVVELNDGSWHNELSLLPAPQEDQTFLTEGLKSEARTAAVHILKLKAKVGDLKARLEILEDLRTNNQLMEKDLGKVRRAIGEIQFNKIIGDK